MVFFFQFCIFVIYMCGGISKGVFFCLQDLFVVVQMLGVVCDVLLMCVIGLFDFYGKYIDGMGGVIFSISKCVIIVVLLVFDYDVDYLYGQVLIDVVFVDWSGNCGNFSIVVGLFVISNGFIDLVCVLCDGICMVCIWQVNIGKIILVYVLMVGGEVQEIGDFELDGVMFLVVEIQFEFFDLFDDGEGDGGLMFLIGNLVDIFDVFGVGCFEVIMIIVGIFIFFFNVADLGYIGIELQLVINEDKVVLVWFEVICVYGVVCMGLIDSVEQVVMCQYMFKVVFVVFVQDYVFFSGRWIVVGDIDLYVCVLLMGKLYYVMMGMVVVVIGIVVVIFGILVNCVVGGGMCEVVIFGYLFGMLCVGVQVVCVDGQWIVIKVIMSCSVCVLMEGVVCVFV